MVIDASVWVALYREGDSHHATSLRFLEHALQTGVVLHVPNLVFAEIAGVFSRETGQTKLAMRTVRTILQISLLRRHAFNDDAADEASAVAARHRLRGADAVYVALAGQLGVPLLTWDKGMFSRFSHDSHQIMTPDSWLQSQS